MKGISNLKSFDKKSLILIKLFSCLKKTTDYKLRNIFLILISFYFEPFRHSVHLYITLTNAIKNKKYSINIQKKSKPDRIISYSAIYFLLN